MLQAQAQAQVQAQAQTQGKACSMLHAWSMEHRQSQMHWYRRQAHTKQKEGSSGEMQKHVMILDAYTALASSSYLQASNAHLAEDCGRRPPEAGNVYYSCSRHMHQIVTHHLQLEPQMRRQVSSIHRAIIKFLQAYVCMHIQFGHMLLRARYCNRERHTSTQNQQEPMQSYMPIREKT